MLKHFWYPSKTNDVDINDLKELKGDPNKIKDFPEHPDTLSHYQGIGGGTTDAWAACVHGQKVIENDGKLKAVDKTDGAEDFLTLAQVSELKEIKSEQLPTILNNASERLQGKHCQLIEEDSGATFRMTVIVPRENNDQKLIEYVDIVAGDNFGICAYQENDAWHFHHSIAGLHGLTAGKEESEDKRLHEQGFREPTAKGRVQGPTGSINVARSFADNKLWAYGVSAKVEIKSATIPLNEHAIHIVLGSDGVTKVLNTNTKLEDVLKEQIQKNFPLQERVINWIQKTHFQKEGANGRRNLDDISVIYLIINPNAPPTEPIILVSADGHNGYATARILVQEAPQAVRDEVREYVKEQQLLAQTIWSSSSVMQSALKLPGALSKEHNVTAAYAIRTLLRCIIFESENAGSYLPKLQEKIVNVGVLAESLLELHNTIEKPTSHAALNEDVLLNNEAIRTVLSEVNLVLAKELNNPFFQVEQVVLHAENKLQSMLKQMQITIKKPNQDLGKRTLPKPNLQSTKDTENGNGREQKFMNPGVVPGTTFGDSSKNTSIELDPLLGKQGVTNYGSDTADQAQLTEKTSKTSCCTIL